MHKPRLLIGVLSARSYEERRQACRDTWADCSRLEGVDLVFLIGDPSVHLPYREKDVLYCPCPDDYESLPLKTRWFCLWALANERFDYLFKCDDDTYVAIDRLRAMLPAGDYVGHDIGGYASGGAGYLLSRAAATLVAGHMTASRGAEDLLVSQSLFRAKIPFNVDSRFHAWRNLVPEARNAQITAHYCNPRQLRRIHRRFKSEALQGEAEFRLWAIHPDWQGEILLFEDGEFARSEGDYGDYELKPGISLLLKWDNWPAELLMWDETNNEYRCTVKPFHARPYSSRIEESQMD